MMVSKKKALEFYMREKNALIEDLTGIELYQESDYEWAHTVSDGDITTFFANFPNNPETSSFIYIQYCPQCFKFHPACSKCTYSNASCSRDYSTWSNVRDTLSILAPTTNYSVIINKMVRLNKFDR